MNEPEVTPENYLGLMAAAVQAHRLTPSALVQPTDRYVRLNGLNFHYLDWGNEHLPHVVLLHGGGLNAHTWDMAALLLRDRFHLVALDQRGSGDSDFAAESEPSPSWDPMVDDVRAFLDALGYERVALVGMSMGGINALLATARGAERIRALVIVDYAPDAVRRPLNPEGNSIIRRLQERAQVIDSFEGQLEREVQESPRSHPDHLRYTLWHSLRRRPDGKWEWKGAQNWRDAGKRGQQDNLLDRYEILKQATRIVRVPTLLMRGEVSNVVTPEAAETMVADMIDARLVVIPNAGHNVQTNNPRAFAEELERFLTSVP